MQFRHSFSFHTGIRHYEPLLDGYESFGWEEEGRLAESAAVRTRTLQQRKVRRMKRNRKLVNKVELTRLERNFEACMDEIGKLEKAKTSLKSCSRVM